MQLDPCPFCGGEAERLELTDEDNFGGSVICCKQCGASSSVHFDRKENLEDGWNRRVQAVQPVPVAWQPIETAPKDGTPVLLHWGRGFHPMSGHCEGEMWGHLGFDWSFIPYPTQPKFWISFDLLPAAPVSGGDNAK